MLLDPGDRVLVEDPSYLAALQAFALAGAVVVPARATAMGSIPTRGPPGLRATARASSTRSRLPQPHRRTLSLERPSRARGVAARHGVW